MVVPSPRALPPSVGAFFSDDSTVNIAGPVTMTGNTALYQGGVIFNKGNVTLPLDAELSGNTAPTCPSIKNWEEWENSYVLDSFRSKPEGSVEFTDGSSYTGSSREMCYFGQPAADPGSPMVLTPETADCDELFSAGTEIGGFPYMVLDTRVVSEMQIEVGTGDFEISCARQSVSGGGGEEGYADQRQGFPIAAPNPKITFVAPTGTDRYRACA